MEDRTVQNSVIIPLLQAIISGAFVGVGTVAVGILFSWSDPFTTGLLVGVIAAGLTWLLAIPRDPVFVEERAEAHEMEAPSVRLEVYSDNGRKGQFYEVPCSSEELIQLSKGIVADHSLAEVYWCPHVMSRWTFRQTRAELMKRGLLKWKSANAHNKGVTPTPKGLATFKYLAQLQSGDLETQKLTRINNGVEW